MVLVPLVSYLLSRCPKARGDWLSNVYGEHVAKPPDCSKMEENRRPIIWTLLHLWKIWSAAADAKTAWHRDADVIWVPHGSHGSSASVSQQDLNGWYPRIGWRDTNFEWNARLKELWQQPGFHMAMGQYLLIPFLVGWTSNYQLFWGSPGVQGFDTLPYNNSIHFPLNHLKSALFWSYSFHFCHLCPAGSLDSYFSERYGEERKSQLQQLFPPKTTGTWWISKYFQAAQACETHFSHLVTCHINLHLKCDILFTVLC